MTREKIDKAKKIVLPTVVILLIVGVVEIMLTSNEFGLTDFIIGKLLIPIIIISTAISAYWILLTEDFWDIYKQIDLRLWTKIICSYLGA